MTTLRQAALEALEALDTLYRSLSPESVLAADLKRRADALREALEQPEQMTLPPWPRVSQLNRGCGTCGIGANGQIMGYVCTRSDCPTRVTCGGVV